MKTFLFVALIVSSGAVYGSQLSIEWYTSNGTGNPPVTRVTPEEVKRSDTYPLGYVQNLIGKDGLCFNGDASQVFEKIVIEGLDTGGDESCEVMKVTRNGRISLARCAQEGGFSTYSLTIGPCSK